jgi:hypothetical protein
MGTTQRPVFYVRDLTIPADTTAATRAARILEQMAAIREEIVDLRAAATPDARKRRPEITHLHRVLNRLSHELYDVPQGPDHTQQPNR